MNSPLRYGAEWNHPPPTPHPGYKQADAAGSLLSSYELRKIIYANSNSMPVNESDVMLRSAS